MSGWKIIQSSEPYALRREPEKKYLHQFECTTLSGDEAMQRRVVVTGLGLVTPLGIGVEETWSALVAGKSGIGRITRFDATDMATQIAGEVKEFKAEDYVSRKNLRRMDIFTTYALAAT